MVTRKKAKVLNLPVKENKVDNMPLEVEGTILKDTDAYLFEFTSNLMPLPKLHKIVDDNYLMSDLNNGIKEINVWYQI
jgi:hypothetical protein